MRRSNSITLATTLVLSLAASSAFAQIGQLNTGGGQANASGGPGAAATAAGGGTTEGPGGVTTDGAGASAAQDGGVAGSNLSEIFIGGNNGGAFVGGGGLQNLINSNRQFRGITSSNVPTGTSRQGSGSQRRVPVAFRIGFASPKTSSNTTLWGNGSALKQVAVSHPQLRSVSLKISDKGIATLTGQALTPAAARLAANLVRLRPGVRKVENRIVVAAQ